MCLLPGRRRLPKRSTLCKESQPYLHRVNRLLRGIPLLSKKEGSVRYNICCESSRDFQEVIVVILEGEEDRTSRKLASNWVICLFLDGAGLSRSSKEYWNFDLLKFWSFGVYSWNLSLSLALAFSLYTKRVRVTKFLISEYSALVL